MTKVALITGATSGIGRATAVAFAKAGYMVAATGRNQNALGILVQEYPENIHAIISDLSGSDVCNKLIETCVRQCGRLDVLVNSAGMLERGDAAETSDQLWRNTMCLNLDIPFYLSRAALPQLRENRGRIINVSSDWGLQAGKNAVAYCTSKAGLIMFTKAMAKDHAAHGITVNAVCPGDVLTPMLEKGAAEQGVDIETWHARTPTGRLTEAHEIASMILYLASDAAAQITGTAILVDGGASV
ncbi:MAG: SDR family oxidoreductase [Kordiimonadaceae bacterium]|nr:SDR family oxidoreductase [Kordiimonadaceae bacterium]